MSRRPCTLIVFLALVFLAAPGLAADFTVNGVAHAFVRPGRDVAVRVTGPAGAPVLLLVDPAPGPLVVGSYTLPVGGSGALQLLDLGTLPAGGQLDVVVGTDDNQALVGASVYAVAAVGSGAGLEVSGGAVVTFVRREVDLVGVALGQEPGFRAVKAVNAGAPVTVAVDPSRHPEVVGASGDLYVVAAKSAQDWAGDPTLTDLSGDGPDSVRFGDDLVDNVFVVDGGTLSGAAGDGLGVAYDLVVDLDQDGLLGEDDLIDGSGAEAGFYVVHDLTLPGPHAVVEILYSGGTWLSQDTYYPAGIASMGELPLVVISHGNGHNYQWYDHIGNHLASYGFVVMSHSNNTGAGINACSLTTLDNTEWFLANLGTIGGGVLAGHVDADNILWIGHSRGGEGVARAYDRLVDEAYPVTQYGAASIRLISSIAPTDFLGPNSSDPHDRDYHLWVGGADADVTGCANNDIAQSYHLLGRAEQRRLSISLHGVGHGDFHASSGSVATGPCLVGKTATHAIMRGYLLPLAMHHQRGNVPAEDYLWRQWESFRPIGAPTGSCVVVDLQLREGAADGRFVLDDYQDGLNNLALSSAGAAVTGTVAARAEGRLDDEDSGFTHTGASFNGYTYGAASDSERGTVFEWNGADSQLEFVVPAAVSNARAYDALSLRVAQGPRHPLTTAVLGDLTFRVALTDRMGGRSVLSIAAEGGGVEEPYQRTSCGTGTGWGAEFETIRLPLRDFEADGVAVDLGNLDTISLLFGPSSGSSQGRLGLDDLQLVQY